METEIISQEWESQASLSRVAERLHRARGDLAAGLPALWFLTDLERVSDPESAIFALPEGSGVIIRDYDLPERGDYASGLLTIAREFGHKVLIGADPALARALGADGVHWPCWALPHRRRRREKPNWLETTSAHTPAELARALNLRLDAAFLSPIFASASHPGAPFLGMLKAQMMARRAGLPVFALGGIDADNADHLKNTHFAGIAAIGALAV